MEVVKICYYRKPYRDAWSGLDSRDVDGAKKTTDNFLKECPGVSQTTSVVQLIAGDKEGALETQKRCLGTLNNVANGIPVVGHVKGAVHYAFGDTSGGNRAMNAATRSTVVIGSGAVAGLASGGIGAIPAGIAAGATYDLTETAITHKPQGLIAAVDNAVKNPNAGNIFEALMVPVGDGFGGYVGGELVNTPQIELNNLEVPQQVELNNLKTTRSAKLSQLDAGLFSDSKLTTGEAVSLSNEVNVLTKQINLIEKGTSSFSDCLKNSEAAKAPNKKVTIPANTAEKYSNKVVTKDSNNNKGAVTKETNKNKYLTSIMLAFLGYNIEQNKDKVVTKYPSITVLPLLGYITEQNKNKVATKYPIQTMIAALGFTTEKNRSEVVKFIDVMNDQSDSILSDCYNGMEIKGNCNTPAKKFAKYNQYNSQKPRSNFNKKYKNQKIVTEKDINLWRQQQHDPNNVTAREELQANSWLTVPMPPEFDYTGAIMRNSTMQGLLHTVLRHSAEWEQVIPNFLNAINNNTRARLNIIGNATPNNAAILLTDKDTMALTQQWNEELSDMQMQIYEFLRRNITYQNYLGERINDQGMLQVLFQVKDRNGKTQIMVMLIRIVRLEL